MKDSDGEGNKRNRKIKIEPLSKDNLEAACKLANRVFSTEEEPPSVAFQESLNPPRSDLRYWVAVNSSGEVVGTVGLYYEEADEDRVYWLSWFCVKPEARNRGIGSQLLQFAINKTRKEGRKILKLYTSTDPNEFASHRLYEKYGFKLSGKGSLDADGFQILYYELKLRGK